MGFFKKLFRGTKESEKSEADTATTTDTNPPPSSNTQIPHPETTTADNEVREILSSSTNTALSPPHPTQTSARRSVGESSARRSIAEGQQGHKRTGSDSSTSLASGSRRGSTTSLSKAAQAAVSARAQAAAAGLNLAVVGVKADDNSFFRALAHQLYGSETLHQSLRHKVADYLAKNTDTYGPAFPVTFSYSNYVDQLRYGANINSAGDAARAIVLGAVASMYGMELVLVAVSESGDEVSVHVHRYQAQAGDTPARPSTPTGDAPRMTPAHRSVTPTALQLNSSLQMDRQTSTPPPAVHTSNCDDIASESNNPSGATSPLATSPGPADTPSAPRMPSQHELNKTRHGGHRRTASVPSTFTATALNLLVEDTTGLFFSLVPRQGMKQQQRSTSSLLAGGRVGERGSVSHMNNTVQGLVLGSASSHLQPPIST